MGQTKSKYFLFLSLIVVLGSALRVYGLNHKSLWLDEIFAVTFSRESIQYIVTRLLEPVSRLPPLYFIILHFFVPFGKDEFIVRLPSVIFGVLSVFLIYKVGELLFGPKEGLIGAFLLSISTMHIRYSQEAYMYSLSMFLSLSSLFLFYKAIKESNKKLWVGSILLAILSVFSHYYMLFIPIIEMVFIIFMLIKNRSYYIMSVRKADRKKIFLFILGLIIVFICLLPLLQRVLNLIKTGSAFWVPWGIKPDTFFVDLFSYFSFGFPFSFLSSLYGKLMGTSLLYMFLLFSLLGLFMSIWEHREQTVLLILWVFFPTIIVFILSFSLGSPVATDYYLIFILPGYLIAISKGITGLANSLLGCYYYIIRGLSSIPMLERKQVVSIFVIVMVTMFVFASASVAPLQNYYNSENENWRAAGKYLEANSRPGDVILVEPYYCVECVLYYYDANSKKTTVISTNGSLGNVKDMASKHERIWFVYSSHATEEKIRDWLVENFVEVKRFTRIIIYSSMLSEEMILVSTKDMRFTGLDSPPDNPEAQFWHNNDSATFNVHILSAADYTISIHAKSIIKSALELVIDGSSKGIITFTANDWGYIELGTFYLDSGSHEIKIVNREGVDLGDTNVIFDQVTISPKQ